MSSGGNGMSERSERIISMARLVTPPTKEAA